MPLYKRKSFSLAEPPEDLNPQEHVFQVRFTKEIFKDYQDYLNRLNLYRQRVWTCKITGKTSLTYEEALVSEHRAMEKVQQIPEEFIVPILHMIQFSTLTLYDLVNTAHANLQKLLFEGVELHGRKDQSVCACKILKILKSSDDVLYEVGWLDEDKKVIDTSIVDADCLVHKKPPVSRSMLKSFIRESTSQSSPWIVQEQFARKHRLPVEIPKELRDKITNGNGNVRSNKIKADGKNILDNEGDRISKKRKKSQLENGAGLENIKKEEKARHIKYPIDDLLVEPRAGDPIFTDRPSPSLDFGVPMDSVGDLLMVWDFCSSFSRLLKLWPFSLEDFEKAICHKDSNLVLMIESHSAILRLLIKDEGEYYMVVKNKKRKSKITQINWTEYLCDFLEMEGKEELSGHLSTIKRGHYGLLEVHVKLRILRELTDEVFTTDVIREQLDEYIGQQQALVARKREEAREKKEEHMKKEESGVDEKCILEDRKSDLHTPEVGGSKVHNKGILRNGNQNVESNASCNIQNGGRKLQVNDSIAIEVNKKTKQNKKDKDRESQDKKIGEQKKDHLEREMNKKIRTNSLGKDRNHSRYWFFHRDGRLFVESSDSKQWGYYTTKEELDALIGSLNPKGEREWALKRQMEKCYARLSLALQKRSKDITQRMLLEDAVLRRSTRVRAQPRDSPATAFRRYINKWKDE